MEMRLELLDTWRRRVASFERVDRLEAIRRGPDRFDELFAVLPQVTGMGPGCFAEVYLGGERWRRFEVTRTEVDWAGALQIEDNAPSLEGARMRLWARTPARAGNTRVRRACIGVSVGAAFTALINRAPGPLHYLVDHDAYPQGAVREYDKFATRKTADNELATGDISRGQWVGAERIDASDAVAKDGDTIAGLRVDGAPWPELRLMMVDAEELALNTHARKRHPETGLWSAERYGRSGYKVRADRAQAFLAQLMEEQGISHIELNPHRDETGAFDDRVDAYGRYLGLVFGGGECFNAALVETGHADIYLYADGRYHVPEHRLKEYYSYVGPHQQSWLDDAVTVDALDLDCGALEAIAALACLSGNRVFTVDPALAVTFAAGDAPGRVIRYGADRMALRSGFDGKELVNWLAFRGNSRVAPERHTVFRGDSIGAYGLAAGQLDCEWVGAGADGQRLAEGLLEDTAYPAPRVTLDFFTLMPELLPGERITLEGVPAARLARRLEDEWGDRFDQRITGRVAEVRHHFQGDRAGTQVTLTAPLRSVTHPYRFLRRIRADRDALFVLRLDDDMVGLDQGYFSLG